jgi:hypothetical protein
VVGSPLILAFKHTIFQKSHKFKNCQLGSKASDQLNLAHDDGKIEKIELDKRDLSEYDL